ncbi:16S rRNA (cytosine(1402)-N(4))-methyltransferase RsmH [Synechococcus sp. RSCCF101]|uniref:16S rRNA (cytosine(1402)-N(4))-methyltransferase RsmH n=1 Tax=Synechococcus sp. RSCCF101 TaxID=2511069 RepID=UPI0012454DB4|nr:16S rRNA (cytosine(1402)-N(4))-methyltransferase RsmH [Synechococcus sp. RSCCF101]QEY32850.1 16S rRNA (cytosine(1402)-N(4))-methyltransferase RsmH [Synechococcus sp. RSCCF101]
MDPGRWSPDLRKEAAIDRPPLDRFDHTSVLLEPVLELFAHAPARGVLLDATLGGAGHSAALLEAHPGWQLIGLDRDPTARAAARERLQCFGARAQVLAGSFAEHVPDQPLIGVLADLGVSSPQLDVPERGFSFRQPGPIDMRMDPTGSPSAADLLDTLPEQDLADLIYRYGEERLSRRIARRLVAQRPWSEPERTTADLAYAVAGCYPPRARRGRIHPATRTFQALRIAVNDELAALETLLARGPDWLAPSGVLAVISFHSLEDRRVKQAFLADPRLERLTRRAIQASPEEQERNPRSRSARLRAARRLKMAPG